MNTSDPIKTAACIAFALAQSSTPVVYSDEVAEEIVTAANYLRQAQYLMPHERWSHATLSHGDVCCAIAEELAANPPAELRAGGVRHDWQYFIRNLIAS